MNEQLSALIDDELAIEDAEHVFTALQANNSAAQAWGHYHLIGDSMRNSATLSADFKHNLMQKLELEPTVLAPNAAQTKPLITLASPKKALPTSWAMAASVTGVMAVGWMLWQTQAINPTASDMQVAIAPVQVNAQPVQTLQTQVADNSQIAQADIASVETQTLADTALMDTALVESAIPEEYLLAHQATAPTASAYYIQTASYSQ